MCGEQLIAGSLYVVMAGSPPRVRGTDLANADPITILLFRFTNFNEFLIQPQRTKAITAAAMCVFRR